MSHAVAVATIPRPVHSSIGRASTTRPARPPAEVERHERVRELLLRMVDTTDPDERRRLESAVVLEHQGVARSIAARYRGRGVERCDLEQLAFLGLVKAVRRWEPGRSEDFLQFAVPTIAGEIKRYFRDHLFVVRPPRRIQEARAALFAAEETGQGRSDDELCDALGIESDLVRQARQAADLCRPCSLDAPSPSGQSLAASWGAEDEELGHVDDRLSVAALMDGLSCRERAVIRMRYSDGWSQARIGAAIGVSQMQVSRLLRSIVAKLRQNLDAA